MNTSDFPHRFLPPFLTAFLLAVLVVFPKVVGGADSDAHQGHGVSHAAMGMVDNSNEPWAQQLKGQTIAEDAISGPANRSGLVELQHHALLGQMARQAEA